MSSHMHRKNCFCFCIRIMILFKDTIYYLRYGVKIAKICDFWTSLPPISRLVQIGDKKSNETQNPNVECNSNTKSKRCYMHRKLFPRISLLEWFIDKPPEYVEQIPSEIPFLIQLFPAKWKQLVKCLFSTEDNLVQVPGGVCNDIFPKKSLF